MIREASNVVRRLLIAFVLQAIVSGRKHGAIARRTPQAVDNHPLNPDKSLTTSYRNLEPYSLSVSLNPGSIGKTRSTTRSLEVWIQLSDCWRSQLLRRFRIPRSIPPWAIGGDS